MTDKVTAWVLFTRGEALTWTRRSIAISVTACSRYVGRSNDPRP